MIDTFTSKREARKKRILENSEDRLKKITEQSKKISNQGMYLKQFINKYF